MPDAPTISVRLLMMLAGHGQPARAEWAARFTFLGVRSLLVIRNGNPQLPMTAEIVRSTGQPRRTVIRNVKQLRMLGMLEPGVVDDPKDARPNAPEKFYTEYDLPELVELVRRTGSYQAALILVSVCTFLGPGSPEVSVDTLFRRSMVSQAGVEWKKIRKWITRLRDLHYLRERGQDNGYDDTRLLRPKSKERKMPEPEKTVESKPEPKPEPEPEKAAEAAPETRAEPASDAAAFDDVPLHEMRAHILDMGRSPDIAVVNAANVLVRRYNERIELLVRIRDVLAALPPEAAATLRARFRDYSDEEIDRFDGYESAAALRSALQRDLAPPEQAFYRIRMLHLRSSRPSPLAVVSVGTYRGRPEPERTPADEVYELTKGQRRRWDDFLRKTWEETFDRVWAPAKACYTIKMRKSIIALREEFHKVGRLPLHKDEQEDLVRRKLIEIIEEAAEDARDNPRAEKLGFTPGWVLTYYRIQLKKGVDE